MDQLLSSGEDDDYDGGEDQSSIKCCHAVTAWRAEQGSCEPVSELRARSREREIGSQSFCSQLETREECKREIGSQHIATPHPKGPYW